MSARFFQRATTRDGHEGINAALLVALAMNPSAQTSSSWNDPVDIGGPPDAAHVEAPPCERIWSSNSVDLLHAIEEGQKEPTYVPLFLHPNSYTVDVDQTAIREVMSAFNKYVPDCQVQKLINRRFPANDFRQHLFTHLRVFLASKPSLELSRADLDKTSPVKPTEIETIVALKQIKVAQKWFAAHFRTVAQIMQTSLYFASQVSDCEVDSRTSAWSAFSIAEVEELIALSEHFRQVEYQVVSKTRALKAKLDPDSRKQWSGHAEPLGFEQWDGQFVLSQVKRMLHDIMWMLKHGPPKFFANHRNEFAELADLLTQYANETNGPSTRLLKNLSFLGRAMRYLSLTAEDLESFEEHCKTLVAHKYWLAPNESSRRKKSKSAL